jgi:hypothetical protein
MSRRQHLRHLQSAASQAQLQNICYNQQCLSGYYRPFYDALFDNRVVYLRYDNFLDNPMPNFGRKHKIYTFLAVFSPTETSPRMHTFYDAPFTVTFLASPYLIFRHGKIILLSLSLHLSFSRRGAFSLLTFLLRRSV